MNTASNNYIEEKISELCDKIIRLEAREKELGRLTVYALKAYGNYGGGMAIVAATDKEQAQTLATGLDKQWHSRFDAPESADVLPVQCDGEPRVLAWYVTGE